MDKAEVMEEARERRVVYPFAAIVGQEKAKLALLAVSVNPAIGGVLLAGDKGTGKSTMVRALADLLPEIEVVEGCPFGCNPHNPAEMCDECYLKWKRGEIKVAKRKMRVIDLPLSITVDRLVGTLDIKRALAEGIRALQPGLLAEANRNILYIDEVNLLDDYIIDVLLDAAAMGWNIVEREGISVKHPARFILIGSMNPEEGELRPQLLDRFGLYVKVEASMNPEERIEIIRRVEEFNRDPIAFYRKWEPEQNRLREAISRARQIVNDVQIDEDLMKFIVKTITDLKIRSHRAEITVVRTAKSIAALDGRLKVNLDDVKKAMELALPHRLRATPFEPPPPPPASSPPSPQQNDGGGDRGPQGGGGGQGGGEAGGGRGGGERQFGEEKPPYEPRETPVRLRGEEEGGGGRRARRAYELKIGGSHGVVTTYAIPRGEAADIHITATLTAAALRRLGAGLPLAVDNEDLRINVRRARVPVLRVVLLDSSGSMAALRRIAVAKGLVRKLAESSYRGREYISLIVFRGGGAQVVVPPVRKYEEVLAALSAVPTGGRTPLPHALETLYRIAKSFRAKYRDAKVVGVLITDGKANVPLYRNVTEDLERLSHLLKKAGVELEIYATRGRGFDPAPTYIDLIASITSAKVVEV
nr:ATP-binding protein [Pyrobaculum neutrophilum]